MATGRCSPFETEITRKDGDRVPVLVGAARLSATRREGVAFVLDNTDRKWTIRRLKAELACVDMLAEATTLAEGADALLRVFQVALSWRSAALWSSSPQGWRLIARDGVAVGPEDGFEFLSERILETHAEAWSSNHETLAIPFIVADQCRGALVLTGWSGGPPDLELLETCRRIGNRIARFIERHDTSGTRH